MAQRCMFFDAVSGDREYDATSWAALVRALVQRDGVIYGYGGGMQVAATEPASMNVSVATGAAFVQGRLLEVHTAAEILGIGAADPTNPRIDRVVVRLDNSAGARSVVLAIKAGTPAASPSPPVLQRDGTVWELSLAQVAVAAGATSISAGDITDERADESVCGYVPRTPDIVHRGTLLDKTALDAILDAIWAKFNASTGHAHDKTADGGAPIVQPAARVYHNAAQSIANDTATALAFNSERFDTDAIHDVATNNSRLTCKTAGKYLISGNVEFAADVDGYRSVAIRVNGSTIIARHRVAATGAATATNLCVSTVYQLAVNDYVELVVQHTAGAALDVNCVTSESPEFSMIRIG